MTEQGEWGEDTQGKGKGRERERQRQGDKRVILIF
jgi:hypothetical protein